MSPALGCVCQGCVGVRGPLGAWGPPWAAVAPRKADLGSDGGICSVTERPQHAVLSGPSCASLYSQWAECAGKREEVLFGGPLLFQSGWLFPHPGSWRSRILPSPSLGISSPSQGHSQIPWKLSHTQCRVGLSNFWF